MQCNVGGVSAGVGPEHVAVDSKLDRKWGGWSYRAVEGQVKARVGRNNTKLIFDKKRRG